MIASEFQQHFGNITSDNFSEIAAKWFQLPVYTELPPKLLTRAKSLTHLNGAVKTFVEQHRLAVVPLAQSDSHFEALRLANQRLVDAERIFLGDDLITARIFTFRRRGWIKEHLSTFGEFSKYPLGDSMRTISFVGGAMDYMQADLELGCASDYGMRASECLGGAGMHKLATAAIVKLFGENVIIMGANSVDALIIKDLARRAIETTIFGPVPGGRDAKMITVRNPNTELN